jgi:hypothetical protein
MTELTDHRQYICGARVVVCTMAARRWHDQRGCERAVKDPNPNRDKCWYLDNENICQRDRMEHEGA